MSSGRADGFPSPPATQRTPDTPERVEQLCGEFPDLAFEAYFGEEIYVHNPNVVTMKHLERVAVPYHTCSVDRMPRPWNFWVPMQSLRKRATGTRNMTTTFWR